MIEWYDVYNIKECTYSFVYIHIPIFVMFKTLFTEHIFNSKKLYIDNVETKVLLILLKKKVVFLFYYILIISKMFPNLIEVERTAQYRI